MRIRLFTASLLSLGMLLAAGSAARAQFQFQPSYGGGGVSSPYYQQNQFQAPTAGRNALSPYLLLRQNVNGVNNPAINYYLGTQTEFQRRANTALFGSALTDLYQREQATADAIAADRFPTLDQTGHAVGFQYYGTYYSFPSRPNTYIPLPAAPR
jgi:hypothetical protein